MPPSRLPRHAAAEATPRRATVVPAVLLSSMALAFGGLAVLPADGVTSLKVTAAAATAPFLIENPATVPSGSDYDTLYGIPAAAPVKKPAPARVAPRASRSTRSPIAAKPTSLWVRPLIGRITSAYKWRWGRMHSGVDIAAPYGTVVRAVTGGRVITSGWSGAYGKLVKIEHDDGTVTLYAHNSALLVSEGTRVAPGDLIARVGSTGRSTGPHVHFEVRIGGGAVNPISWLAKRSIYL